MIKKILLIVICFMIFSSVLFPANFHTLSHNRDKNGTDGTIWFNLMLNGKKAGYFSFCQHTETKDNNKFILRQEEMFMKFNRSHHVLTIHTDSFKRMDSKGRLLRFEYRSRQDSSKQEIKGALDYKKGIIEIVHTRDGSRKVEKLNIRSDSLTEYQALDLLKKRRWIKGDSIRYSNLMTEKGCYITVNMEIGAIKKVISGSRPKNLYKVVRTIENIPGIQSITWVDSNLIPHKGELIFPNMKYTLELTSKEDALKVINSTLASLNLARIRLNNFHILDKGENRNKIKKTVLLLKLKEGKSFVHELSGGFQHIRGGNLKDGLTLIIDTNLPEKIKNTPIGSHPETLAPFLHPNSYIESDEGKIIALANRLLDKRSAWETAVKIKKWVYSNIIMTFETGFASALEVLNSGKGDCTEHAVITAAICRACAIPARVVLGYNLSFDKDENPLYVGHMWNEVFIHGTWIPIDSTSPDDRPDPFRIRFFTSSLENRDTMKTTALFTLTKNLDITLLSTAPSVHKED